MAFKRGGLPEQEALDTVQSLSNLCIMLLQVVLGILNIFSMSVAE